MWVKPIVLLISAFFSLLADSSKQNIRSMYAKSVDSKQMAQNLLSILEKQEQSAFVLGYRGATKMVMAKHVFNPFTKLSYFNAGKKMLNTAISKDNDNVELVFLRYATQVSAPAILGYNRHINMDKKQILNSLGNHEIDEQLAKTIISFMKVQELTPQEQQLLAIATK
ncbi:hypothetical protein [Pedobacter nanyangensis]|uniref:hypothetical protein n=1 Tax=Pedobacter nanyangensis TaxID=1562389 RepID=UPI000DE274A2|nr:hypothetical protein [Pedobacter nanyangensis]